jgi:cellulose synthase/poly-beta-1,6-N-acetylglucosamine synthase-like glycosyltransferase
VTPATDPGRAPLVTVVIPTHGRPRLLERALHAVFGQAYPPDQLEIIVVATDAWQYPAIRHTEEVPPRNAITVRG